MFYILCVCITFKMRLLCLQNILYLFKIKQTNALNCKLYYEHLIN